MSDNVSRHTRVDHVARRFYRRFNAARASFLAAIQGIAEERERERCATFVMTRLMFLYYLQHKGLLAGDSNYLSRPLRLTCGDDEHNYYHHFLMPLLSGERSIEPSPLSSSTLRELVACNDYACDMVQAQIPDTAFEQLLLFFDEYCWSLTRHDGRSQKLVDQSEDGLECDDYTLDHDVLGYIFEQYVNEQQMGAYYTRADVTRYIARNTILPSLIDRMQRLFPAMSCLQAMSQRLSPSRDNLLQGAFYSVDDLVTRNIDLSRLTLEMLTASDDLEFLYSFYCCLLDSTILDPTCGSGAFLFAALDVLEPLYTTCIQRLQTLVNQQEQPTAAPAPTEPWRAGGAFSLSEQDAMKADKALLMSIVTLLERVQAAPNTRFFVLSSLLTHNLYGVDIMEDAIDICRLRLALELLSSIDTTDTIGALPQLSHTIRTGNTLVGSVREDDEDAHGERWSTQQKPFHWHCEFRDVMRAGRFDVILGNPPYVEYDSKQFSYLLSHFETSTCANLYPCVIERSRQLLSPQGRLGMIVPLAAVATRNMQPFLQAFHRWFPQSWLSFYHFRPSMLFSGGKMASIPTAIILAKVDGEEQRYSTSIAKWTKEERDSLFPSLSYCRVTARRDPLNKHYYPKFGSPLENGIMEKILAHPTVDRYLTTRLGTNSMFYRSAGGLYWKVFLNFPWPYETTSNKRCTFQDGYDRDIFVALFNSSLFWWYYTVTFDTFNVKDYMLFGFRFSYPQEESILGTLSALCHQLMLDYQHHARHLKRRTTGSYTVYAKKSKAIIDEIDRALSQHYGFADVELDFIINYDIAYRMGMTRERRDE